ncbi:MAG: peptidase [Francisellaceae bacterium]|nr:peptidase [Francisellaceae bacterium]
MKKFIITQLLFLSISLFSKIVFAKTNTLIESNLPDIEFTYDDVLSVSQEKLIGEKIMRSLRASGVISHDRLAQDYIKNLGSQLATAAPLTNFQYDFFIINDTTLNAFAFFGAHVGIHSGLIIKAYNESELAAVIAHEMAHIKQKHLLRILNQNKNLLPLTIAELIAAIAISSQMPEAAGPLLHGVLGQHTQHLINFTRAHEQEADRIGIQILANAHFDPEGMPNIFNRLQNASRYNEKNPEYLSTHPLYENRVSDAKNRAEKLSFNPKPPSLDFYLIKARLEIDNQKNIVNLINLYSKSITNPTAFQQTIQNYSLAYAFFKNKEYAKSLKILNNLAALHPKHLIIHYTLSEVERMMGNFSKAQNLLINLQTLYPHSIAVNFGLIECLLITNPKLALDYLKKYNNQSLDPYYFELLARVHGKLGNLIRIHEAEAENYLLLGDFKHAKEQLDIALLKAKNHPEDKNRLAKRKQEIEKQEKIFKKL